METRRDPSWTSEKSHDTVNWHHLQAALADFAGWIKILIFSIFFAVSFDVNRRKDPFAQ